MAIQQSTSPLSFARNPEEVFLSRREAAEYLNRSIGTLEKWAADGTGPKFRMIGAKCSYTLAELRRFAGVRLAA